MTREPFDIQNFMPYLLNQAAEASSSEFQSYYKTRYGMLRTEWRVVFHLGRYGTMTAKEICDRAGIHKTKISRAVAALESKRYLKREQFQTDKRLESLELTHTGQNVFKDLCIEAEGFDTKMMLGFTENEKQVLRRCLRKIVSL